jgi:hypothetical protein
MVVGDDADISEVHISTFRVDPEDDAACTSETLDLSLTTT